MELDWGWTSQDMDSGTPIWALGHGQFDTAACMPPTLFHGTLSVCCELYDEPVALQV